MASSVRELLTESVEAQGRANAAEIADLYHPSAALYACPGTDLIVGREAIAEHFDAVFAQTPHT